MELKDFKTGMKIKHTSHEGFYYVDFITRWGNVVISWDDDKRSGINKGEIILHARDFSSYIPYVEKAKVKLYHYLYVYKGNTEVFGVTTKTPWKFNTITRVLKQWEEEVEYEVPTGNT